MKYMKQKILAYRALVKYFNHRKMIALIAILLVASFYSCSSVYIPQTPNIPLHKEKGESTLNAGLNTNSFILNGSYALTGKYAILGGINISYGNVSDLNDFGDLLHSGGELSVFDGGMFKHYNLDIGFGRFINFSEHGSFELYAGGEYGQASTSNKSIINNYGNIYLQSNIGFRKPHFELGGMVKINGAYMNYRYPDFYDMIQEERFPVFSVQWGGILRVGGENVKFWFSPSLNFSHALVSEGYEAMELDLNNGHFYTVGNLSLGMSFRF